METVAAILFVVGGIFITIAFFVALTLKDRRLPIVVPLVISFGCFVFSQIIFVKLDIDKVPPMKVGETAVVLAVYDAIDTQKDGNRAFIIELTNNRETRITSKDFFDGDDLRVQVGDRLVRTVDRVRLLGRLTETDQR